MKIRKICNCFDCITDNLNTIRMRRCISIRWQRQMEGTERRSWSKILCGIVSPFVSIGTVKSTRQVKITSSPATKRNCVGNPPVSVDRATLVPSITTARTVDDRPPSTSTGNHFVFTCQLPGNHSLSLPSIPSIQS